jgi:UDP-N-acetylmuramate--alanine ligase
VIETVADDMAKLHNANPIDWVVSSSSITRNTPGEAHLKFARLHNIKVSERDECINEIMAQKNLKMIAAAGTHGKTTTTAMLVWAMGELGIPISYSIGAKTGFSDMGHYEPGSEYFVYECDEFHRNFLQFHPFISVISGITWDHHEVFPTQADYNQAFLEFISQSEQTYMWDIDASHVQLERSSSVIICNSMDAKLDEIQLAGLYNRRDAWLVVKALQELTGKNEEVLIEIVARFPGIQRRMEELGPGLFTDYAHTPEKISGCMSAAKEIAGSRAKNIVVVYEPLTNRRQYFMREMYRNSFLEAKTVYWVPSYLAREDSSQPILSPSELITYLNTATKAIPMNIDDALWRTIEKELSGSIVVCMSGGGGNSLDEWLRLKVREKNQSAHQD